MQYVANLVSLAKLPLSFMALVMILNRDFHVGALYMYCNLVLDFFDGMLARKFGSTKHGEVIDAFTDAASFFLPFLVLTVIEVFPIFVIIFLAVSTLILYLLAVEDIRVSEKTKGLAGLILVSGSILITVSIMLIMVAPVFRIPIICSLLLMAFLKRSKVFLLIRSVRGNE